MVQQTNAQVEKVALSGHNNKWTPEEDTLLLENYKVGDIGTKETIASLVGRTAGAVVARYYYLAGRNPELELKTKQTKAYPNNRKDWSAEDDVYVLQHFKNTAASKMAEHLGRSVNSITVRHSRLIKNGITVQHYVREGDADLTATRIQNKLESSQSISSELSGTLTNVPIDAIQQMNGDIQQRTEQTLSEQYAEGLLNLHEEIVHHTSKQDTEAKNQFYTDLALSFMRYMGEPANVFIDSESKTLLIRW